MRRNGGRGPSAEIVQGPLACSELSLSSRMKGETPVNSTMSIGQARKMVEQLKIEASLCRIKVGGALDPISWQAVPRYPNLRLREAFFH